MLKSGSNGADENFYSASIHSLLKARTPNEYESTLADVKDRWSPAFGDYYNDHIQDSVRTSAAFAISHLDIVCVPYVGITNNVSESYNRVLRTGR